jgi:hypothetical protein
VLLLALFASFVAFDGCILSRIETAIDNDDITVIDPIIEIAGYEKTHSVRMRVSYVIAVVYFMFAVLMFWIRF